MVKVLDAITEPRQRHMSRAARMSGARSSLVSGTWTACGPSPSWWRSATSTVASPRQDGWARPPPPATP